jgi:aspartate/methionine/tyrosine aminotransferase
MRRIPPAGVNLFQLIYTFQREYTKRTGLPPLNLSLGNPDTVPPEGLLLLQARFAKDPAFELHTYAEDGNLKNFAEGIVEIHSGVKLAEHPHLRAVPIPGIKGATTMLPLACGLHLHDRKKFRYVSNLPAYDVIGTWGASYYGAQRVVWPLSSKDDMKLNMDLLKKALKQAKVARSELIFVIRPGNPAGVGTSAEEWKPLIEFCIEKKTRLVNDAAYAGLAGPHHVPLARVAAGYPDLEWAELYSVSKSFSDPGARLGCMVGSKDFVEDYMLIKGNTDSGPVPYVMAAYGTYFQDRVTAKSELTKLRQMYAERLSYVADNLVAAGLQRACSSDAPIFTLWKVPKKVLGVDLAKDPRTKKMPPHEAFNRLVTDETGIVGVHFQAPEGKGTTPLIRYAMCTNVLDPEFQERFEEQLDRLKPEY